ncbi:unnamed protein product [Camellia sinensis]
MFRRTRGMYFSVANRGEMMSMVYNWPADQYRNRILGLGDLGLHGIGIAIEKLDLYVAAAGINPQREADNAPALSDNSELLVVEAKLSWIVHIIAAILKTKEFSGVRVA